jgi:hypothetical protein
MNSSSMSLNSRVIAPANERTLTSSSPAVILSIWSSPETHHRSRAQPAIAAATDGEKRQFRRTPTTLEPLAPTPTLPTSWCTSQTSLFAYAHPGMRCPCATVRSRAQVDLRRAFPASSGRPRPNQLATRSTSTCCTPWWAPLLLSPSLALGMRMPAMSPPCSGQTPVRN